MVDINFIRYKKFNFFGGVEILMANTKYTKIIFFGFRVSDGRNPLNLCIGNALGCDIVIGWEKKWCTIKIRLFGSVSSNEYFVVDCR